MGEDRTVGNERSDEEILMGGFHQASSGEVRFDYKSGRFDLAGAPLVCYNYFDYAARLKGDFLK